MTAVLPDCPTCGGTKYLRPQNGESRRRPCPENDEHCDGKVSVAQLAALWQAVHGDERDLHMHDAFSLIEQLRAVRP